MFFRPAFPRRSAIAIPFATVIVLATALFVVGSPSAMPLEKPSSTADSMTMEIEPVAPYIALRRVDAKGNFRKISESSYIASSDDAVRLIEHLATSVGEIPVGVIVLDARGRSLSLADAVVVVASKSVATEADIVLAIRATLKTAENYLRSKGCSVSQIRSLSLSASTDLAQAVSVSRRLGAGPPVLAHSDPHTHSPHVGAESRPGALPSVPDPGQAPANGLEACLIKIEPDSSHRDNWLHNVWHRITGTK